MGCGLSALKVDRQFDVDLSARQIVRHGVLLSGDICNPVVGVYVVDAEEVQTLSSNPQVANWVALLVAVAVVDDAKVC